MSGGGGGQTPVFYNLPMIVAAWLVLRVAAPRDGTPATPGAIRRHGAAAMLLVGLALQIKTSAVFEGIYLGLALGWIAWRRAPGPWRLADMLLWIAIVWNIAMFWRVDRVAAALLLPYLGWVSFASALNIAVWQLN